MKKQQIQLLFSLLLISTSSAFAGGWLQGKGNGYFKLSQTALRGDRFYNGDGKSVRITTAGVYNTSFYGEYGLSDKLDVFAYAPLVSRLTLNDVRSSTGRFQKGDELTAIGDADIGVKYGIRQGKSLVISASLLLGLPIGNDAGGETGLLQSGDGEFNQLLMVDVGYGFDFPLYANVGVGFNNRTNDFSEEFRATAELGYKWRKKLTLSAKFATVQSLNNGNPKGSAGTGIFSNNLEYVSFGPELSYLFSEKVGFSMGYATASSGQFIIAAPSYSFGIFMELR